MTTVTTSKKITDPTCTSSNPSTEWKGRSGNLGQRPVTQLNTKGPDRQPLVTPLFLPESKLSECLQRQLDPGIAKQVLPLATIVAGTPASREDIQVTARVIADMVTLEAKKLPDRLAPQVRTMLEISLSNCTAPPEETKKPKNSTAAEAAAAALAQIK